MRLKSLHLENFRGFESFDLDLHEDVSVLIGVNASGKTAILDALAIALGAWISGLDDVEAAEDRTILASDARLIPQESQGLPTANSTYPVVVAATGSVADRELSWTREKRGADGRTTRIGTQEIRDTARVAGDRARNDETAELPLVAYYGTGRLWVQRRDSKSPKLGPRTQGYAACLAAASNTKLFQRWMEWRQSARLQRLAAGLADGRDPQELLRAPHLDAVVTATVACLPEATDLYWSANHRQLQVSMNDGRVLPFDALSDGQRSLVVLAADIAWRAAQLNPSQGEEAPGRTRGVVLIDELELHLHPSWQRGVLGSLRAAFPNIQFIVTTHSPQVLASAEPSWIRVLGESGATIPGHSRGKDTNAILRELMGGLERPRETTEKLANLERSIEAGNLEAARALLDELKRQLGHDEALLGLEWELHASEIPPEREDAHDQQT